LPHLQGREFTPSQLVLEHVGIVVVVVVEVVVEGQQLVLEQYVQASAD